MQRYYSFRAENDQSKIDQLAGNAAGYHADKIFQKNHDFGIINYHGKARIGQQAAKFLS